MVRQLIAGFVVLMMATPAAATEAGENLNPLTGDLGSAIWTLLTFGVVVLILRKFAWDPILGVFQKREDFIRESLAQAKRDREQAEATLKEYTEKLHAAKLEATAIVEEGRRDAEVVKHKIADETRREAEAMIARAKREIGIATDTAVKELYDLSGQLATDIAARIIRKELNAQEHERLIAESIDELSRINRN